MTRQPLQPSQDSPESEGTVIVTLHGTRGSMPACGPAFARYGNHTICFEVEAAGRRLLFDAGSGLHSAGRGFMEDEVRNFDLFLSHFHYDHVMGLPMFKQLYLPGHSVRIWSGLLESGIGGEAMLQDLMRRPFFPIGPDCFGAEISWRDFIPGAVLEPAPGIRVLTTLLNHPGGAVGYRIEVAGRVIAIVTDTEHIPGNPPDPAVLALIAGADLMLYDANFTDAEMEKYRGWGHSSWQEALRLAALAGVGRIGLIHHSPWRDDSGLDIVASEALSQAPGAFVGRDGQRIRL